MILDSSPFMIRAVIVSLILHSLFLWLLSIYTDKDLPIRQSYKDISVFFSAAPVVLKEEIQTIAQADKRNSESILPVKNEVPEEKVLEQDTIESIRETVLPQDSTPVLMAKENEILDNENSIVETESPSIPIPESAGTSSAEEYEVKGSGEEVAIPGEVQSPQSQNGIQWKGESATGKRIPDADFTIPHGQLLSDKVIVQFSVFPDGTVHSVKITPPGSGSLDLDQQIRSYVQSFLFVPYSEANPIKKAILELSLKGQERELL